MGQTHKRQWLTPCTERAQLIERECREAGGQPLERRITSQETDNQQQGAVLALLEHASVFAPHNRAARIVWPHKTHALVAE